MLTVATAKALREYLSVKNMMAISTALDKDLGLCKACKCVLELKVHTPIAHVLNNLTDEQRTNLENLNPKCWVLTEAS